MNFFKANTFVSMELFGTGVGGRKEAFISVAKNVASRLWTAMGEGTWHGRAGRLQLGASDAAMRLFDRQTRDVRVMS